jgi:molybdopterin/thiamine biosynthesis adenylyltransferase
MRHTCTVQDLGRLKTDAVRDAILGKNPFAGVDLFPVDVNLEPELLEEEIEKADLVICATDNNQSRFTLQRALLRKGRPCIFGRAVTRAEGGDVFRYCPGGPCYCCLIGNDWYNAHAEEITDEASARRDGRIAAYVSPEDAAAVVQVGLSADIAPICNLMEKLALIELSRGTSSPLASLDAELVHDYYMWANRRERHYGNWAPFPAAGAKPTILRWYGARIARNPGCAFCAKDSSKIDLDTGGEIETRLADQGDVSGIVLDLEGAKG